MSHSYLRAELPGVSTRAAVLSVVGFWAVWLMLVTARASAMGWPDQGGMLLRRLGMMALGIALAWTLHWLFRALGRRPLVVRGAAAFLLCIPATAIFTVVNVLVFYRWFPVASVAGDLARWDPKAVIVTAIADGLVTWYFFFAAWGAFYLAIGFVSEVRAAERAEARANADSQTARLAMLRMQVDPHFLFNALNALSSLVARGKQEAAGAMIRDLAAFFRAGLVDDPVADIPLADEIENQQLYLVIEQARFGDRLIVEVDVPDVLGRVPVPALILQPLIENAVKHGLGTTSATVTLTLVARDVGGWLQVTVTDWTSGERSPSDNVPRSHGIGLANVRDRLTTRYGDHASLEASVTAHGWQNTVMLPLTGGDVA